mmetsp:Transcript_62335/g.179284  ORF Transcript_62335/g.179284 Transcript_62335/m.179284 type:complete len:192 (-) Transcript_62335:163-738(-)
MVAIFLALAWSIALAEAARYRATNTSLRDSMTVDEAGALRFENGTKWDPLDEVEEAPRLPSDAFVCHAGSAFAVQIPARPGRDASFYYLKFTRAPQFWPLQIYLDAADSRNQFIILPPLDSTLREWKLVVIQASKLTSEPAWADQRIYPLGEKHPCGAEADWEEPFMAAAAAKKQTYKRRGARAFWDFLVE